MINYLNLLQTDNKELSTVASVGPNMRPQILSACGILNKLIAAEFAIAAEVPPGICIQQNKTKQNHVLDHQNFHVYK